MARKQSRGRPAKGDPGAWVVQLDTEPLEATTEKPPAATIVLRSIVNDDGHFQGLEVA